MLLAMLQTHPLGEPEMLPSGWLFMGLAWLFVVGLVVWCFVKVLWGGKPS